MSRRRYPSDSAVKRELKRARENGVEVGGYATEPNGRIEIFDKSAIRPTSLSGVKTPDDALDEAFENGLAKSS
jgi:hypothetical protein